MPEISADYQEILDFWFAGVLTPPYDLKQASQRWFASDPDFDELLSTRFGTLLHEAEAGSLDEWCETALGSLAWIVLLDQFSRNIYRGSGKAFGNDHLALRAAKKSVEKGYDREVNAFQRVFFYLPFEHSETLEDQSRCLELFQALQQDVPEDLNDTFAGYYDYAIRHHNVIAKFGRFPHRNQRLGRESTIEELEFLNQPGSSFG